MTKDEVLFLKCWDSHGATCPPPGHGSVTRALSVPLARVHTPFAARARQIASGSTPLPLALAGRDFAHLDLSGRPTGPKHPGAVKSTFSLHTAFADPTTPAGCPPRESIEVRTIVMY